VDNDARRLYVRYETYHDLTYFTPESRAATDAIGCKGGWMGYFAQRAAPMGAASPETVTSAFYNFHPSMVHRALPDAWRIASPEEFLATRLLGVDGAVRRMLGDDVVDGKEIAEAADIACAAAAAAPTAGRPLAVANAQLPQPKQPHLALWQATTMLREQRGDGHIAALIAADLDPCEALVIYDAEKGIGEEYLRAARNWPAEDWAGAGERLIDRGLLHDGTLTEAGTVLRRWVEDRTDQAASAPWAAVGKEATDRLADLLTPIALALARQNEAMRINPMGLDAVRELAG
jgi:hypothetical protein